MKSPNGAAHAFLSFRSFFRIRRDGVPHFLQNERAPRINNLPSQYDTSVSSGRAHQRHSHFQGFYPRDPDVRHQTGQPPDHAHFERGAPFVESEKINQPVLINNLDGYKVQAPFKDPDLADVPFLIHSAMIRLPLFENGEYYFCLNFWSDDYDAFTWTHVEQLQRLVRPLAGELRERLSFTEEKALPYTPAGSGFERLSLCPELAEVRQRIELAAPTRTTVLILGETGSGKESVADAIHERSDRRNGPFLKVNCGTITPSLLSSELFGHEKGAFTGAHTTRRGYFEQANGGTLFLDEIGEMPQEAQVHLLRVLESRYVTRVGDHRPIPVDVRVIAATQTDLMKKVREGTFRKDLWFRLAVLTIVIPPLRDRKADIPALVRHFLRTKAAQFEMEVPDVPAPELERLYSHDWPGNVRELEFVIERSLLLSGDAAEIRVRPRGRGRCGIT